LPDADAIFLDTLINQLSFEKALLTEPFLIAQQIVVKIRRRKYSPSQFLQKRFLRPITHPETLSHLREVKIGLDKNNAWVMQGLNEFNDLIRHKKRADQDILQFFIKLRTTQFTKKLNKEVEDSLKTGQVTIRAEDNNPNVMNWASRVVYELITKHRFSPTESQKLCHFLKCEKLEFIPTLKIKAELEAIQFYRREKIEPRDQYDITRAACALPYADIFITDNGKATAIRELKLDRVFKTQVFSIKKFELAALAAKLREIVD
jgi:hypothetical protein